MTNIRRVAQSRRNLRFYAVKVLNKEKVVRLKQVDHTNSEQGILLSISHPFIINLWGTFQDATNLYMIMDFVHGGELFTLLRKAQGGVRRVFTRSGYAYLTPPYTFFFRGSRTQWRSSMPPKWRWPSTTSTRTRSYTVTSNQKISSSPMTVTSRSLTLVSRNTARGLLGRCAARPTISPRRLVFFPITRSTKAHAFVLTPVVIIRSTCRPFAIHSYSYTRP